MVNKNYFGSYLFQSKLLVSGWVHPILLVVTLPETNITPRNGWSEYYFPIGAAYFLGMVISLEWLIIILYNPPNKDFVHCSIAHIKKNLAKLGIKDPNRMGVLLQVS